MIKQKIAPQFFKKNIVSSKMPEVFFDPLAKIQIFIYETNQEYNSLFLNENENAQRIVNYKLFKKVDIYLAQNFTKQINPYQDVSVAKTIGYQSEIEFYTFEKLTTLIRSKFYFFTFELLNPEIVKDQQKFMFKEFVENLDKNKFRFLKMKGFELSSLLLKNYQYWLFQQDMQLENKKVKSLKVKVPYYSLLGNLKFFGNKILGEVPQEIDYQINSIVHPFDSLEPILCNFAYKGNTLSTQFVHFDVMAKAIQRTINNYFVPEVGQGTNEWRREKFEKTKIGMSEGLAGYITGAAPFGVQTGMAELLARDSSNGIANKDAPNEFKTYFWLNETYASTLGLKIFWNLRKCMPVKSLNQYKNFLANSNPTFNFEPWWGIVEEFTYGKPFYNFTLKVANAETFEITDQIINHFSDANSCSWMLAGTINFYNIGIYKREITNNKNTWLNPVYFQNDKSIPFGFMAPQIIKKLFEKLVISNLNYMELNISFNEAQFLNKLSLDILIGEKIDLTIIFEDNSIKNINNLYTNFYIISQNEINTTIAFL